MLVTGGGFLFSLYIAREGKLVHVEISIRATGEVLDSSGYNLIMALLL